jgi:hypothetical protein
MNRTLSTDWSPAIEATVRAIAAAAVACYVAGLMVGTWLHRLNDRLARVVRSADPSTDSADVSIPVPPAVHPLAALADTLQSQPVAALRRKAGVRSKRHRKGALVAQLVAC